MDNKTLIDTVAARLGKPRHEVSELADSLAATITDILNDGNSIAIPSVGTFESKMRAERISMHPSTGIRLLIPPKIMVIFKPSALFKQKIR